MLEKLPVDTVVPSSMEMTPLPLLPEPNTPLQLWSNKSLTVGAGDISEEQLTMGYWMHIDQDLGEYTMDNIVIIFFILKLQSQVAKRS